MKIDKISWLIVMERGRIPQFQKTIEAYKKFGNIGDVQFVIATRSIESIEELPFMQDLDTTIVQYTHTGPFFTPAKGFNEAFKGAKYHNIMVAFPEVRPETDVLAQFRELERGNYVCKVIDLKEDGTPSGTIIMQSTDKNRNKTPAYYFLAIYKREDIEAINGWDEDFMDGFWYDDNEFGWRFWRSEAPFSFLDHIVGAHQYHSRAHYNNPQGQRNNLCRFKELEKGNRPTRCINGITKTV